MIVSRAAGISSNCEHIANLIPSTEYLLFLYNICILQTAVVTGITEIQYSYNQSAELQAVSNLHYYPYVHMQLRVSQKRNYY